MFHGNTDRSRRPRRRHHRPRRTPPSPAAFEIVEPRTLLATYYVSPAGNDAATGTSPTAAFKTIAKVNSLDLNPGDKVLFQGGQTFNPPTVASGHTLNLISSDSGTAADPVTIGSYGTGRATINAGNVTALKATNVAGLVVRDLNFVGTWDGLSGTGTSTSDGLVFISNLANNAKINHVRVDNVDVSRFKLTGIAVRGQNVKAGFTDFRITNSASHDNGDHAITFDAVFDPASTLYAHANVYVGWTKVYNNGGLKDLGRHSGNGIILGDVNGGTIERCLAYNNGQNCNSPAGGPVGIWVWDSNAVTLQYNESYGNQTGAGSLDGGGFDLDGGSTNCIVQYNYSHDNDGAGILLYQFSGARAHGGNIVRYNVSQNDARQGLYAGIKLGGGSAVKNNQIYGNTIYLTPSGNTSIAGIKITGIGTGNTFRNNIVYTTGGVRLLDTNSAYATGSALFQGNAWYPSNGAFAIRYGGTSHADLAAWRAATGQEKNGTANTGTSSNPNLVSPGGGGTIGDAAKLHTLTAYQLLASSPAINGGVNLASLGVSAGARDYFGTPTFAGSTFDIGAFEWSNAVAGASGNDTFILRKSATGRIELFVNAPSTAAAPTYVWAAGVLNSLSLAGNAGDDEFTLDLTNGSPLPAGGASFDGGAQTVADTVNVLGTAGKDTIAVTGSAVTPGGSGASLSYTGANRVVVDTGASDDQLLFNNVTGVSLTYEHGLGNDALSVNTGTYTFAAAAAGDTSNLAVTVAPGASAIFSGPRKLAALNVSGVATLAAGGGSVLVTKALTLSGAGRLDVNDNAVVIDYAAGTTSPIGSFNGSAYTGIAGRIARGTWMASTGIVSTAAAANVKHRALGTAEASEVLAFTGSATTALFAGHAVDKTSVILRFTLPGDADLNGRVNGDDYFVIDSQAYNAGAKSWSKADFDYNGKINGDDYFLIDSNVSQTPLLW
ncbi:MAG TPA: choice-of-anchor Q domain-containing protein [Tepidisphaeraceae bacterium]|nr:choice-of-anchor Q domain-containing protein [Tepidisphaeraceae bacterium]